MADYDFYAGILRFVANTSERTDPRITAMMECLDHAATEIEAGDQYDIPYDKREFYARALAGVGAFLQERILPETVAEENKVAELQIRWAIDVSMETMTQVLKAQAAQNPDTLTITFPPLPELQQD